MTDFNMPPGVSSGDIPGNTADDEAWEKFHRAIDEQCGERGLTVFNASAVWVTGLRVVEMLYRLGRDVADLGYTLDDWINKR